MFEDLKFYERIKDQQNPSKPRRKVGGGRRGGKLLIRLLTKLL